MPSSNYLPPSTESPLPWAGASSWHYLKRNLLLGLRAACFMRLPVRGPHATWHQCMALLGLSLLMQLLWDVIHIGRAGELALNAAPGALFMLPVLLIAAWAQASLARRSEQTLMLLVSFYALTLPIDFAWLIANRLLDRPSINQSIPNWGALCSYAQIFWLALAAGVASARLLQRKGWRRRWLSLLLAVLTIAGPLSQVYLDRSLWVRPIEDNQLGPGALPLLDTEEIFYLQPKLLDQALNAIRPASGKRHNLYFVGAAGYAGQDVFMKEVEYVNQLFHQRYGVGQQSIMLINNPKTAHQLPIASTTSLRAALLKVGAVMNPQQDILFLYLSSHGSKDFKFSLDFGNMHFNDLDPDVLRDMLDEAGIVQRVIVISACYSGGFIDALKDDNSLIISASAPDKTSFGCSNEADFTYFGRAYFKNGLQQTNSFIDAFTMAKHEIAAREKIEGYESSDPQIWVGKKIGPVLGEYVSQHLPIH